MKKNEYFAALFLCNLALITHNTPNGVNSSIFLCCLLSLYVLREIM